MGPGEYIIIYVDDMMVIAPTPQAVSAIISELNQFFPVTIARLSWHGN